MIQPYHDTKKFQQLLNSISEGWVGLNFKDILFRYSSRCNAGYYMHVSWMHAHSMPPHGAQAFPTCVYSMVTRITTTRCINAHSSL